jgi:hypothetical protein
VSFMHCMKLFKDPEMERLLNRHRLLLTKEVACKQTVGFSMTA